MIEKVVLTAYRAICDRCGISSISDDIDAWANEESAKCSMRENGWKEINGKIYCPDCVEYDEKDGEYIPKKLNKVMEEKK